MLIPTLPQPAQRVARKTVALALVLGLLSSCVTVNVNFPESAVQSATDDYVKDLYRTRDRGKNGPTPAAVPTAQPSSQSAGKAARLHPHGLLPMIESALLPYAFAEAPTLSLSSTKEREIQSQLAAHLDEVLTHKRSGALGESTDGMLVIKTTSPLLKKKLEALVERENSLRAALYKEVQSEPGMKNYRLGDIQKKFGRSFQAESPSGTWVQDASGTWSQKN